jgi:hypothetical protein
LIEAVLQQRQLVEQARRETARRRLGWSARERPPDDASPAPRTAGPAAEAVPPAAAEPEEPLGEVTPFPVEVGV